MSSEILYLDTSLPKASQVVLPEPPLLASTSDNWPSSIRAELHRQPPHLTPTHTTSSTLLCIHTGQAIEVEWWVDHQYFKGLVTYNQMTLYPGQIARQVRWMEEKSFLLLGLEEFFADDILGEDGVLEMSRLTPQLGVYDPFVREIGQLLRQQLENEDEQQPLYIESLSLALGVYLAQHYSEPNFVIKVSPKGLPTVQVRQVRDYVDAHLCDPIRLKDMAQLLGLSTFHFSRLFKEATHMAPYQFVMRTRIERAKNLLRSQPHLNISDIAFRCGFSNHSHFANHFRKWEGVSPKRYRQDFE